MPIHSFAHSFVSLFDDSFDYPFGDPVGYCYGYSECRRREVPNWLVNVSDEKSCVERWLFIGLCIRLSIVHSIIQSIVRLILTHATGLRRDTNGTPTGRQAHLFAHVEHRREEED